MSSGPLRFSAVRGFAYFVLLLDVLAAIAALALGGVSFWQSRNHQDPAGLMLVAGGVLLLTVGVLLYAQLLLTLKSASNSYRTYDCMLDMLEQLRKQTEFGHSVAENSSLSDAAKRIVYREKDYEFLRDTIQAAVVRQDWESAGHLITELETQFGYRDEGRRMREEIERARRATNEEKIAAAIDRFEMLCAQRKWEQAASECARVSALFPADARIVSLARELDLRKQEYKRHLLKEYDRAAAAQAVDQATRLLVELDRYLAPNEAAALKDSARGVFKARLMQMGVAFSLAVDNKQFQTAIEVGQRLIREFPNSRYAHEIATMMPLLRQRAAQEGRRDVAVTAS